MIGTTVAGRYLVESRLGRGGMGVVYRARQQPLGRPVALKVLADSVAGDPAVVQRFEKEAQAVSRLNHPNIVTVYEFGRTEDGLLFLAMELIEGASLYQRLKDGPLSQDKALDVTTQVARALAEAHAQGIVHRDLKPENVMLTSDRDGALVAKVLDFGLAKMVGAEQTGAPLTSASIIMGTPGYMSPEQIHARALDARTDLYSLGMVWWEMLVGRPPFAGDTPIELLVKHLQLQLPTPSSARPQLSLSAAAERLMLRLGAKDPQDRPQDGSALVGELRALKEEGWSTSAGGALAGASDADWDQAFAAVAEPTSSTSSPSLSLPPGAATERFANPDATVLELTEQSLEGPAHDETMALPSLPSPSAPSPSAPSPSAPSLSAPSPSAPSLSAPSPSAPSPGVASAPASAASSAAPPLASPSPSKPSSAAPPAPRLELKPEFDFPPRPPPPSAFRPPPNPFAGSERLELGRAKPGALQMPFPEERPAPAPEVKWQVRASGVIQGPLTFSELLSLVRAGSVRSSDDAAPLGEPFRPLESYPLLARELASRKGAPLTGRAVGAQVTPLYRRVAFLGMFALAAAAGVGYGLAPELVDERLADLFGGLTRLGAAAGVDVGPHPLQRHLLKWQSELGGAPVSGPEALAAGRTALKAESLQGHQKADSAFRQGLLVEPENPSLLAAFAENRAWLRAMGHDAEDLPLEAVVAYAGTRREGPPSLEVARAAGTVLALRGAREQAAEVLEAAERLDAKDASLQTLLALARLDAPARAKRHAEKALRAAPGSTRVQLVYGMAARRLGEHDEAVQHLEARVRVEPKDALAGRELAMTLLEQGLPRRATRALEVAYAETGDPITARLFAATLLQDPAGARRADSLLAEASKRAEVDPDGAPLLALRAWLLLDLGHAQQAVVVAEDAARRFPRDGEVKASLGRAYEGTGRLVEARRAFRQAEALVRGKQAVARVIQQRADLELRAGDRAASAEAYEHSLSLAPERAGPRVALAVLSLERDDESAASVALMGLLEVDPRQDRERERLLEPFALAPFALYQERAAAITKNDVTLVPLVVRGVSAYHGGDLVMAERAFTAALRKDRAHPVALLYAAVLDLEQDEPASAQRRLQLLEVTVPEARAPQLYLARLEAEERPQIAEARLGRLQADGRFRVEVSTTLGLVEAARGRPEKAAYHLRSAFLQDPSYLPVRRALASAPVPLE